MFSPTKTLCIAHATTQLSSDLAKPPPLAPCRRRRRRRSLAAGCFHHGRLIRHFLQHVTLRRRRHPEVPCCTKQQCNSAAGKIQHATDSHAAASPTAASYAIVSHATASHAAFQSSPAAPPTPSIEAERDSRPGLPGGRPAPPGTTDSSSKDSSFGTPSHTECTRGGGSRPVSCDYIHEGRTQSRG